MAILTANNADSINRLTPTTQAVSLGSSIREGQLNAGVVFEYATSGSIAADTAAFVAPFAMRITLVTALCTVAETNGAIQPKKNTTAMCTAITCAVNKVQTAWAAGIETAQLTLAAGDVVNIIGTGDTAANTRGVVTFYGYRL